jgi:hypothetical protein
VRKSKIYLTREVKAIALLGDKSQFQYEILIEFTLKNQKNTPEDACLNESTLQLDRGRDLRRTEEG